VPAQVIVLNGGSGAGKTTIARALPASGAGSTSPPTAGPPSTTSSAPWKPRGSRGSTCGATRQADLVHRGVRYDLEVETTHAGPMACAEVVAARVR
jgi:chloramphenicol 3-O-phosphotransferase